MNTTNLSGRQPDLNQQPFKCFKLDKVYTVSNNTLMTLILIQFLVLIF